MLREEHGRGRRLLVALLLAVAVLLPAVPRADEQACTPDAGADFVTAVGSRFMLNGCPWRAIGVNFWDMDAYKVTKNDYSGCYYMHPNLDEYFDSSFKRIASDTHATVVRTFAFREQYTNGGRDFASTDKLLHYARKHNVRVIPVFGDQAGGCGTKYGEMKEASWYHCPPGSPEGCVPGYKQLDHWDTNFRDYVIAVAQRYAGEETIAFWQLMNEAFAVPQGGVPGGPIDVTSLTDFARDMVTAIRTEAGDTNHLISLGTLGVTAYPYYVSQLPYYGTLLDCGTGGGCTDVASAHYYGGKEPLQGTPVAAGIVADLIGWNAQGQSFTLKSNVPLTVDGWSNVTVNIGNPAIRRWALGLRGSATQEWTGSVDDAIVTTALGPQAYSFETGLEGFTATGAVLESSPTRPRTGLRSLRVRATTPSSLTVQAPDSPADVSSISVAVRLGLGAPFAADGQKLAPYLREAIVARGRPFVLTEAGLPADTPLFSGRGLAPETIVYPGTLPPVTTSVQTQHACTTGWTIPGKSGDRNSLPERAALLSAMMDLQLDEDHGSSGFIVWDWKDPASLATAPDGSPRIDPNLNCYSTFPGDPLNAVIASWADKTPNPPLPSRGPLPPAYEPAFAAVDGPPATVTMGSLVPVKARMTRGGNAMRGVEIVATGGCVGNGVTDALGSAFFNCRVVQTGTITVTLAPWPDSCGCSSPGRTYTITAS